MAPMNAGGRWVPAPYQSYAPTAPTLAGTWGEITLPPGPSRISTPDGYEYRLPALADVEMVSGARNLTILHVTYEGQKYVLARGLQQLAEHPALPKPGRARY